MKIIRKIKIMLNSIIFSFLLSPGMSICAEAVEEQQTAEVSISIIGGADGPTSIFLAGKVDHIFAVAAAVMLILGIMIAVVWKILKKK